MKNNNGNFYFSFLWIWTGKTCRAEDQVSTLREEINEVHVLAEIIILF